MATLRQLIEAGIAGPDGERPPAPWHRIRGSSDASTLWYAVMVKRERGIFIATLCFRHTDRQTLLVSRGWREVPVPEIGVHGPPAAVE